MRKPVYRDKLHDGGLRITPQRIAVLEAIESLNDHPTAEEILQYVHKSNPNISSGTVYKTLETLVEKCIIKRVNTGLGIMRYDGITEDHHHLYCSETERIEDYYDDEVTKILDDYFSRKKIVNFRIEDIKLQITGKFIKKQTVKK